MYSVTPVCGSAGVAAYIHGDDRYRLKDPLSGVGPELIAMLEQQFGQAGELAGAHPDVLTWPSARGLTIAGLDVRVLHAPGHTERLGALSGVCPGCRMA